MSGIIHISLDNSQADSILAKTLRGVEKVEDRTEKLVVEVDKFQIAMEKNEQIIATLEAKGEDLNDTIAFHQAYVKELDNQTSIVVGEVRQAAVEEEAFVKKAERDIAKVQAASSSAISNIRRGAALGTYVFQAIGFGIGQSLSLLAETVALTIETAKWGGELDTVTAFSNPLSAVLFLGSAAARVALIAGLIYTQLIILRNKDAVSAQFNAIVGGLRILTI